MLVLILSIFFAECALSSGAIEMSELGPVSRRKSPERELTDSDLAASSFTVISESDFEEISPPNSPSPQDVTKDLTNFMDAISKLSLSNCEKSLPNLMESLASKTEEIKKPSRLECMSALQALQEKLIDFLSIYPGYKGLQECARCEGYQETCSTIHEGIKEHIEQKSIDFRKYKCFLDDPCINKILRNAFTHCDKTFQIINDFMKQSEGTLVELGCSDTVFWEDFKQCSPVSSALLYRIGESFLNISQYMLMPFHSLQEEILIPWKQSKLIEKVQKISQISIIIARAFNDQSKLRFFQSLMHRHKESFEEMYTGDQLIHGVQVLANIELNSDYFDPDLHPINFLLEYVRSLRYLGYLSSEKECQNFVKVVASHQVFGRSIEDLAYALVAPYMGATQRFEVFCSDLGKVSHSHSSAKSDKPAMLPDILEFVAGKAERALAKLNLGRGGECLMESLWTKSLEAMRIANAHDFFSLIANLMQRGGRLNTHPGYSALLRTLKALPENKITQIHINNDLKPLASAFDSFTGSAQQRDTFERIAYLTLAHIIERMGEVQSDAHLVQLLVQVIRIVPNEAYFSRLNSSLLWYGRLSNSKELHQALKNAQRQARTTEEHMKLKRFEKSLNPLVVALLF